MAGSRRRCVSARQLGLLLWKNSILKRRSYLGKTVPIFLVIEIVWPILLFAILAGMRSKFPAEQRDTAVFQAFALPSAGALPFLQSAICDFGGQPTTNYTDMPAYRNASVSRFYSLLEETDVFQSWNGVCSQLEEQLGCFSAEARLLACQQQDPIPLDCTLRDPNEFSHFLSHDLGLSDQTADDIIGAQFQTGNLSFLSGVLGSPLVRRQVPDLPDLPDIPGLPNLPNLPGLPTVPSGTLGQVLETLLSGPTIQTLVCGYADILNTVVIIQHPVTVKGELCTLNTDQFQLLADELRDQMLNNCSLESLDNQGQTVQSLSELSGRVAELQELVDTFPMFDNTSDEFDNLELFLCGVNRSDTGLLDVLKRFTQGDSYRQSRTDMEAESAGGSGAAQGEEHILSPKIFFTPDTPCTRSIIHRANRTFAVAGILVDWSHSVATCSAYLLRNDTRSTIITAVDELVNVTRDNQTTLPEGVDDFVSSIGENLTQLQEALDPNNPDNLWLTLQDVHDGAQELEESLRSINWDVFTPISSQEEMVDRAEDYTWQDANQVTVMAGLVFDDVPEGGASETEEEACPGISQPKLYIRMNSSLVHDTTEFRQRVWRPGPEDGRLEALYKWKRVYQQYGFVFIQDMVERALLEEIVATHGDSGNTSWAGRVAMPGSYVEQMPYPCHEADRFTEAMEFVLPLTMIFAWLFPIAMTIRGIVREKETRLREFMKMMGLSDAVLRSSWFLTSGTLLFISVVGITILLKSGLILPYSDWFLIMLYMLLYAFSMIGYSFLVSVFFTNANLAACVGCLLYFLVFFAHITLLPRQHTLPSGVVVLACLWSPLAYGLGASFIVQYELRQVGVQWSNVGINAIPDDALSIQTVMVMLVVDTLLYMLLVWYIEGVWPGRYGVGKPLYFPFQPSYWLDQKTWAACKKAWCNRRGRYQTLDIEGVELLERNGVGGGGGGGGGGKREDSEEREMEEGETTRMFEEEPSNLPLGISISHLSKTYSSGLPFRRKRVKAVRNLSLNFYEGQITAFLGHNGAGKTTTMSVLTGLYEPSRGTAHVYGQDIRTNMDDIRHSLGLCPQHNILFDLLTVREHLLFYGMMRGLSYSHVSRNIPSWLSKVGLSAHANKMSMYLSGGMKRKLSVLLAFVGESQTIILDEPTSGVDPFARRQIWDFLLRHRDNRTVMLSTHHMDEAEILGDRIAILSQGSLICSGSFEFLRHNYGRGHRLSLVTNRSSTLPKPSSSSNVREGTDGGSSADPLVDNTLLISRLIQNLIPSARLEEARGREMRFLLPLHQARPHTLTLLFSQLETQANEMGVTSYGLTACSMEEIFVRLTHKEAAEAPDDSSSSMVPRPSLHSTVSLDDTTSLDSRGSEGGISSRVGSDKGSEVGETAMDEENAVEDVDSVFQLIPSDAEEGEEKEEERGEYGNEGYQGPCLKGPQLWLTQALALLVKRGLYTYRRSLSYTIQTVLPLLLIILGLGISNQLQTVPNQSPLELTPSLFLKASPENYMFTGGCNDTQRWTYNNSECSSYNLDFLNGTNISTDPSSLPLPIPDAMSLPNTTTPLSNYPANSLTDFLQGSILTSPAASEYLASLYRPCGIGASELDAGVCEGWLEEGGEAMCHGVPELRCSSLCDKCNSTYFPTEPPTCFDGSQSRTKIQNVSYQCGTLEGAEEANRRLVSYLLGTKVDYVQVRYGGVSFGHVRSEVSECLDARNMVGGDDWPFLATRQAAKAWHSFKGYHALPAYVNTLSNAILRAHVNQSAPGPVGVRTYNHPFKYSELKRLLYSVTERKIFLVNPLAAIFSVGFIAASFVLFLIEERSGKTLHLQLVCGMSRVVYWLVTALWDLITYLLFMSVVILLYVAFEDQYYSDPAILPTIVLLFVSYGVSLTPWMYALSFLFRSPATAYIVLFCLNFFSGFSLLIVDAIIVYINGLTSKTGYIIPHLLALPFPSYPMARSLMYVSLDRPLKRVALVYTGEPVPHPLEDLWPFVVSLWAQAVVYTAIVVVVQFSPNFLRPRCRRPLSIPEETCDDENVEREEKKVREGETSRDILTLKKLTKVYGQCSLRGNSKVAVNRLHLSMKPSECFGLLGVNGAGKTTTFRMLTGDTRPTLGDALILGRSVQERGVVERAIGYCPQVDALIDQLSGRQHLTLYARLRGVPRAKVPGVVEWALGRLDLMEHADKPAGQYSGGNRRRLSAAIALLGAPQLLLLDEPTSGVDPAARQFLWSVIRSVASAGQSVLLTTHSMAECEALCSRVGIMVNGSFRCLGTPQQLKSRYGDGYRLKLRVSGELEPIQEFIRQRFPHSVLKEKHLNTLVYQLPRTGLKLSEAFRDMERGRETLGIRDYSLSQTTLDDVFIHFASQQSEERLLAGEEEGRERHSGPLPDIVNHSRGGVRYTVVKDDVTIT